ncbi:hypothetical protein Trydic_g6204 [Trypoxylus dichotomus]
MPVDAEKKAPSAATSSSDRRSRRARRAGPSDVRILVVVVGNLATCGISKPGRDRKKGHHFESTVISVNECRVPRSEPATTSPLGNLPSKGRRQMTF